MNEQTCKSSLLCLLLFRGFSALHVFKLEIASPIPQINNGNTRINNIEYKWFGTNMDRLYVRGERESHAWV